MRKLLFTLLIGISALAYSQAPQQISYQGVARNSSGTVVANQPIGIRFDIHQGSASGAIVFSETHTGVSTNSFGLFTTYIGSISNLSVINWATNSYFIEVSIDPNNGTYSSLGSQQLMSVPYALNAGSAPAPAVSFTNNILSVGGNTITIPAGTTYTAGTGINVSGNTISNTAPDQTVTLNAAGATTVSGTYPNFTINTPTTQVYTAGNGIDISSGVISNTLTPITPTITSTGIAVVTPTAGNTFNVDVPIPVLSYTAGTNVLSLTQGTTVTTATLNGTGSNTINIVGSGIATVTTAANNYTVNVPPPTYNSTTGVLGFGTNTVSVTPTLSLTGTTLTSGVSTNSVNLAALPGLWSASSTTAIVQTNTLNNVGIGMPSPAPQFKLDVAATAGNSVTIHGFNTGATDAFAAVYGENNNNGIGVYAQSNGGKGVFGKSTSGSGVYGESTTGDGGKFILSNNSTIANAVNAQTNGTGAAIFAKSFNAVSMAAKFEGATEILHTASQANPTMHLRETTGGLNRIKFSNNTVANKFFETAAQTNAVDANGAYSINYFDGTVYKPVLLVTGERKVSINNLNTVLTSLHVMENATTAGGGIASEGFARAGQINLIRNNQPALAARTAVVLGDEIGRINFAGYDGVMYGDGAKIYAKASENVTSTSKGTDMYFAVVPNATSLTQDVFKLANDGVVTVNPNNTFNKAVLDIKGRLRVDSSLTMSSYNTPPSNSFVNEGRIYYDRPSNKFKVSENGGAYVDLIPGGGTTPWTQGAGVVFLTNATDKVGIGTTTPVAALDVTGNLRLSGSQLYLGGVGGINSGYTGMYETGTDLRLAVFKGGAPGTGFAPAGNSIDALTIQYNSGNVGIGTNTPNASLDIKNNAPSLDGLALDINNVSNGSNGLQLRHFGVGNAAYIEVNNSSSNARAIQAITNSSGATIDASTSGTGSAGMFAISNASNTSSALNVNTNGTGNAIYASNTSSTSAAIYATNGGSYDGLMAYSNGGRAIYAQSSSTAGSSALEAIHYGMGTGILVTKAASSTSGNVAAFNNAASSNGSDALVVTNSGAGNSISASNSNPSTTSYAGSFDGGLVVKGKNTASADYALKVSSSSFEVFGIKNNGNVGINILNPTNKLQVNSSFTNAAVFAENIVTGSFANAHGIFGKVSASNTNTLAAGVFGNNAGAGPSVLGLKAASDNGVAARFENLNTANIADGIFVSTNGGGAAIHAVNGPTVTGGSNVALWIEAGHIKTSGTTPAITTTLTTLQTYTVIGNDIAGKLSALTSTLTAVPAGQDVLQITFSKAYPAGTTPVIILTNTSPNSFAVQAYVTGVTNTGFKVRFNSASALNTSYSFNYLVVE